MRTYALLLCTAIGTLAVASFPAAQAQSPFAHFELVRPPEPGLLIARPQPVPPRLLEPACPDLVISDMSIVPPDPLFNWDPTLEVTVENVGNVPSPPCLVEMCCTKGNGCFSQWSWAVPALMPGQWHDLSETWDLSPDPYLILAYVDPPSLGQPFGQVLEFVGTPVGPPAGEANNQNQLTVP